MTLGGLCLLVPVPFAEFVEAIDDRLGFTGNEGAGLSVNRTREGEVTGDSRICDTDSQRAEGVETRPNTTGLWPRVQGREGSTYS